MISLINQIIINVIILIIVFFLFVKFGGKKLGINLKTVYCPKCNTKMPNIRIPQNSRETLYGGWTCKNCSCEMDKWGKKLK